MKKNLLQACWLLLLIAFSVPGYTQFLAWDYLNIADDLRESGINPDMLKDAAGTIHISYWHRDEDKLVYLFRQAGDTAWSREYVDVTGLNGYVSAIALDSLGRPAVAYQEGMGGVAQIRFATRIWAGNWQVEVIPGDPMRGWGGYGPNAAITEKERVVHSIELVFNEAGEPQILFFDGWMDIDAFPACNRNSEYGFHLHQAMRAGGSWITRDLGHLSDVNNSCGGDTLPYGDRYGEYASLLQRSDGRMEVFCLSRFNNRLIKFDNPLPQVDSLWQYHGIDSMARIKAIDPFLRRFATIEGISAHASADESTHLAYTTSLFYGENFCCDTIFEMVYARLSPTDTFYHGFGVGAYRNHTGIVTHGGPDSVFIAYVDMEDFQFKLQSSADSGQTWVEDVIMPGISLSQVVMETEGDSLLVLMANVTREHLVLGRRHVNGGPWRLEQITTTERKGQLLDAVIRAEGGDTVARVVYADGFEERLYYAQGTQNTGWNWNIMDLPGGRIKAKAVALTQDTGARPVLAYSSGNGGLRMARQLGGNWLSQAVDASVSVSFVDVEVSALDTVQIVYYDEQLNCLKRAWQGLAGGGWNYEVIDCGNEPVGQYPSLQLDPDGMPHVAYFDENRLSLVYARQNAATRAWEIDSVNGSNTYPVGKYASLRFAADGRPWIAYLDEGNGTVMLSRKTITGQWQHETVDSAAVTNLGRPIRLEIDQFGKAWLAYNYYTNFDKVKLVRRENGVYHEVGVSSVGQIAGVFEFATVGGDLYLAGRKNQPGNTGVAMLHAPGGLYVQVPGPEELSAGVRVSNHPNPFSEGTTFILELDHPQSIEIELFDLYGKRVAGILEKRRLVAGTHEIHFEATGLAPGVYIYLLRNERAQIAKKMMVGH